MKRRPVTLVAVASLGLCIATVGLWVRSCFVGDYVTYTSVRGLHWRSWGLSSSSGLLAFGARRGSYRAESIKKFLIDNGGIPSGLQHWAIEPERWWSPERGFDVGSGREYDNTGAYSYHFVRFPHWLRLLLTGPFSGAWFVARVRGRRRCAIGTCLTCGYDLRAMPERCPECGSVASASPA